MGILGAIFGPGDLQFNIEHHSDSILILAKGKLPEASCGKNVSWHTSIRDDNLPVLSLYDEAREPDNLVYSFSSPPMYDSGLYYKEWFPVGIVVKTGLQGPYKGSRNINIELILYDTSFRFPFHKSYSSEPKSVCFVKKFNESYNFEVKGYVESIQDEDKAKELSISIMMGIAMSDGHLDDSEGNIIKKYIKQNLEMIDDTDEKNEKKKFYNDILKTSHKKYFNHKTTFDNIRTTAQSLYKMNDDSINRSTISLCYDIMAADGKIQDEELEILNKLSNFLKIDEEFKKNLLNKKLLSLNLVDTDSENYEITLGINKDWTNQEKVSYLNKEFSIWNNRLSVIDDKKEKENANHMLHMIAEVKKKYG